MAHLPGQHHAPQCRPASTRAPATLDTSLAEAAGREGVAVIGDTA